MLFLGAERFFVVLYLQLGGMEDQPLGWLLLLLDGLRAKAR